ncbi:hypothetical protein TcasGA2_TC002080 [Tribolium castaneum]|uniref:RIIa domain-containing protein n=1 Tax=Tribolium castaneum TaxID=7070 RepID=D7EIT8_TRICA|nr:PREDICTED: uncharacterized protein LOC655642 [Tribolium castaneum]EFA12374.1 hypothetical protein TcasGA2_TC002080 [Tribolium castaneum]|eukprot:XP_967294.1 PREDICTED: uncharacterized protein LOC655642 [Tribolium castaneum]
MDPMLQRHCARYIYVVPDGLRELLSDISREVLRSEPEDIYTFIADYLDALLITRENARISAKFVQYMTEVAETIVDLLKRTGMSREEADAAANVIQEAFKSWSERKGILKEDEDLMIARIIEEAGITEGQVHAAAVVIQHAFRAFKARQQREAQLLSGIVDWRVAARSAIRLYRKSGVSPEEAKRAANLIKAAYKGYYTRRAIRQLNEEPVQEEEREEEVEEEESLGSFYSEHRKSKGVRIDFNTVVPHVDFGGEELISRDIVSVLEEEQPPHDDNIMARIFGELPEPTVDEIVNDILNDIIIGAIGTEEEPHVILEEMDSDIDSFVPPLVEEKQEATMNRSQILPVMSQEELDMEMREARLEMLALKRASRERQSAIEIEQVERVVTPVIEEEENE